MTSVLVLPPLAAQSPPTFEVRLISWGDSVHDLPIYLGRNGEYVPLSLRTNRRSEPYAAPGGEVRLFTDGEDAEGNPSKVLIGQAVIPEGMEQPLLVLFDAKTANGSPRYRAVPIEDSPEVFPFGAYRIFNFTDVPVVFQLGDQTHSLQPREIVVAPAPTEEHENVAVRILARIGGEPKILKQSYWRHQPDQRIMVFALRSADPERPDIVVRVIAERKSAYQYHYSGDREPPETGD